MSAIGGMKKIESSGSIAAMKKTSTMSSATVQSTIEKDAENLQAQIGYEQVLNRGWGGFTSMCVTMSAMSVFLCIPGEKQAALLDKLCLRKSLFHASCMTCIIHRPIQQPKIDLPIHAEFSCSENQLIAPLES